MAGSMLSKLHNTVSQHGGRRRRRSLRRVGRKGRKLVKSVHKTSQKKNNKKKI